jgi:Response regulator of the LytR/AlgR family
MIPLRVLVVDDEDPARRKLRRLLHDVGDVEIVGEAASGDEAVEQIVALAPELVLLDVQMPVLDGFEVVASVGVDRMPPVVFVTAYDEHALRAFDVRAIDYLLKPVAADRLREALDRVRQRVAGARAADSGSRNFRSAEEKDIKPGRETGDESDTDRDSDPDRDAERQALASLVGDRPLRRILVHDDERAHLLPVDAITLARAERNYVVLHTPHGTFKLRGSIGALAGRLDPSAFLRVNRSDVVRLDAIRELQPWSHGDYRIVLADGKALFWSRRYRAQVAGAFELR